MGVKERRTKILLILFLISDTQFAPIQINEKIQSVFDLSFNQKTRGTISALLKEELIKKQENEDAADEKSSYQLTDKGFRELCLHFPFFRFLKEKWDGKWRIISYEIPEKKREIRDRFRREMQGWGLGPWHRSFWLTPHPIIETLRELVAQKEERSYIQAFEAEHSFGDRTILIDKVWNTQTLSSKYRELFKVWHEILSKEGERERKLRNVIDQYVSLLKEDPGLPSDLVGQNWIGYEAFNIFKEVRGILLS